jgi:dihydroflavonol-4-reductase
MQRALVTGGLGFLGSAIVRGLLDRGVAVRALAAPGERRDNLAAIGAGDAVEVVEGDVRVPADCRRAVAGVDTVFHAAAIYADWAPDPTAMYDVNVHGTFHVLEAARRAGVARVVYTASIVALGRPAPGAVADEDTPYEAWDLDFPYSRSKLLGRQLAERFADWGLDVRVVCPGIVLGPNDLRPTPSGQLILSSLTVPGPTPVFDGGASYVDVRDAAEVHLLAAERGVAGRRYIATGHDLDNAALLRAIDRVTGTRRITVKVPVVVARAMTRGLDAVARRTGTPPLLSRDFFEYSLKPSFYDAGRSIRELGARYRPIDDTLRDAVAYFRATGRLR